MNIVKAQHIIPLFDFPAINLLVHKLSPSVTLASFLIKKQQQASIFIYSEEHMWAEEQNIHAVKGNIKGLKRKEYVNVHNPSVGFRPPP